MDLTSYLLSSFCVGTRRRCGISTDLDVTAEWLRHDSRGVQQAALARTTFSASLTTGQRVPRAPSPTAAIWICSAGLALVLLLVGGYVLLSGQWRDSDASRFVHGDLSRSEAVTECAAFSNQYVAGADAPKLASVRTVFDGDGHEWTVTGSMSGSRLWRTSSEGSPRPAVRLSVPRPF